MDGGVTWRSPLSLVGTLFPTGIAACLLLWYGPVSLAQKTPADFIRIQASLHLVEDGATGIPMPVRTDAFWISRTEITQAQFEALMQHNPSASKGPHRPVENVTWLEAIDYANRRSLHEGLRPCYGAGGARIAGCDGYRLPTEMEWRIAAGAVREFPEALLADAHLYRGPNTIGAIHHAAVAGTRDAGSGPASALGLHDLAGNVWEWCEDRFHTRLLLDAIDNPRGPQTGAERVLRGGSYLTRPREWNKGFRTSMPPDARSPYAGFRLVRPIVPADRPAARPPAGLQQVRADLPPSSPDADFLRRKWLSVLGQPKISAPPAAVRVVETITEPSWSGRLLSLEVEPGRPWRALMVLPAHIPPRGLPMVVVPYYDVDTPSGADLGGRNSLPPGVRAFAHIAAQYGFASLAVRWAGENDGPGYYEVVADLERRHPGVTGLGYWVWQAQRLASWLESQPEVDPARIAIMGHSLGGKMALYAAAFEPRFRAIVSSEPGISLPFTNYGDPWYLGEKLYQIPDGADQHELLQLLAPRPFLLIAGESADGDKSIPTLRLAAPAYHALGNPEGITVFNHRTGHSPTVESVMEAMEWLRRAFTP